MGLLSCFCSIKEKKDKVQKSSVKPADMDNAVNTLHVKFENLEKAQETKELRSTSFTVPVPFSIHGGSRCKVKVMSHDSPIAADPVEVDYEGGDEHDDCSPMKRGDSDFDLQTYIKNPNEENHQDLDITCSPDDFEFITSGHVSDPGKDKREFWPSPKLKRSCSSLEMRNINQEFIENHALVKSKSYENILRSSGMQTDEIIPRDVAASPLSVMTHYSADKVMLKRRSSSQILPSRSRRLWWKLLLWSHRNTYLSETTKRQDIEIKHPDLHNKRGGYSSDTVEPFQAMGESMFTSPNSFSAKSKDKGKSKLVDERWDGFYGATGTWPQNQWIAFPSNSSPLARVDEWVKEVSSLAPCEIEDHGDEIEKEITFPPSPEKDTERGYAHLSTNLPEEILHANRVIQSLNASSTVAHMTAIALKVVPSISHFTSLRSVNLSGNSIVHITSGSLPKGLHVLDLSRNKINAIEGLRELTRLRVLDLSYNRISRIGQGLSSCTIIKELYLAGNKLSNVEGLHRLLKLTVLDLSFNKITTTKAVGQLVANYNSLIALNLLGNPIQSNISDDQLRKTMCSLLPKLSFLNKQPITPKKARDIHANAIARAALGSTNMNSRRKGVKRVSNQGNSSSSSVIRRSNASTAGGGTERGSKHRLRSHPIRHVTSADKIHQSPMHHRLEE